MLIIRPSTDADLAAITEIYAYHVQNGTGTFEVTPPSVQDMGDRRKDVLNKGLPWLVAIENSRVIGFAYCNWFKPRPAYRFSAEDSIYLHPTASRKGVGRLLLMELMAQAQRAGVRKLIAVIGDSANLGSIGVHKSAGFQSVGVLKSCGWKFNQWLDVVLMDKSLGEGDSSSPAA
ncbi:MAG TPA: N-acetyltransferase family protein [Burkholderiaceae bacterium]|nr:N-acetyltransferase family protein [Burkholderiaceae bacterium]